MAGKKLSGILRDGSDFVVTVELTGAPNFGMGPIEHFLKGYKELASDVPDGFNVTGLAIPQNPGGVANLEPVSILSYARENDLLGDLDFIPHVTCKDHNVDTIISMLMTLKRMGVDSILAFTGDKPVSAKGVFEVESVGLIDKISSLNAQSFLKAKPEELDTIHQFYVGAAVSPFKYTEASQMQQYYKMEKKIAAGAQFLVTQVGWDWRKSKELFNYLSYNNIDIPVIGNVFLLSGLTPAPRLMHDGKLPGCFVSGKLLDKLSTESLDEQLERAAQQVAMYKDMGAAGVDIGSVHDMEMLLKILTRADEIGPSWQQYKDNLYFPAENPFYVYDEYDDPKNQFVRKKRTLSQVNFDTFHRAILDPDYRGFHAFKAVMGALGAKKRKGFVYRAFNSFEKAAKYVLFHCEACGDCYLTENFGRCTMGGCEKGLANVPCGDANEFGYCGNNLERKCIGEFVYNAAAAKKGGIEKWRKTICAPRDHSLEDTSSILNHLFSFDHGKRSPIINIADAINAFNPITSKVMKALDANGNDAYNKSSNALSYLRALIEVQAREKPDYILLTLDKLSKKVDKVERIMTEYVKLVRKWGRGVSVCIDSEHPEVLAAGLKEWYNTDQQVKKPILIAPSGIEDSAEIFAMKKQCDFNLAIMLCDSSESVSVDGLVSDANTKHSRFTAIGFKPDEIFFELSIVPLSKDVPESPSEVSSTHLAFETIKRIKAGSSLKKSHCFVRVSIASVGMPRSIGVCRAFAARAMELGMDAGVVNVAHRYGFSPAAPVILDLVDAYANADGSEENHKALVEKADKFFAANKKAKKK